AYTARRKGEAPEYAPLAVEYADYTLWQREALGSEQDESSAIARQIGYWRKKLEDLPAELGLAVDRPRPSSPSYRGGTVGIPIGGELYGKLAGLARERGATVFMVLQAALAALLSKLGGGSDIAIGAPVAGRTEAALDPLVGFFVN